MSHPIQLSSKAVPYYFVAGVFTGLMVLFVALRLYIRFRIIRKPWLDDAGAFGLGTHKSEVSIADQIAFEKWAVRQAILITVATYFTKLTLLLLYLRLFEQNRPVKLGIWAGIIVCSLYYTITMFLYIFLDPVDQIDLIYASAIVGVITDVYIICLPLCAVAQLHLNRTKKWRVAAVFMTGLLAVVMGFLGCIYRFGIDIPDSTYSLLSIYSINTVEIDIGIICTCLPLLGALFKTEPEPRWRQICCFLSRRTHSKGPDASEVSNKESRTHYGVYHKRAMDGSGDDIELVQSEVTAEASAMAGGSGGFDHSVIVSPGEKGIWRQTRIQQQYSRI
ncbi:hypothetical protein BJX99DRAFT_270360 [Aspergillus californicus]